MYSCKYKVVYIAVLPRVRVHVRVREARLVVEGEMPVGRQ